MATVVSEIYDALLEDGASQDKARKAAEVVASYETRASEPVAGSEARSHRFERDITKDVGDLKREVVRQGGDLNLLKWMVGFNSAATVAVLVRLLFT